MWPNVVGAPKGPLAQPPLSPKLGTGGMPFVWAAYTLLFVVEPWSLLVGQWEGFTQASQLQGLAMTTDHQPPPSMEDQLCRGRVVMLQHGL